MDPVLELICDKVFPDPMNTSPLFPSIPAVEDLNETSPLSRETPRPDSNTRSPPERLPLPLKIAMEPESREENPGESVMFPLSPSKEGPVVMDNVPLPREPEPVDKDASPDIKTASPDPKRTFPEELTASPDETVIPPDWAAMPVVKDADPEVEPDVRELSPIPGAVIKSS